MFSTLWKTDAEKYQAVQVDPDQITDVEYQRLIAQDEAEFSPDVDDPWHKIGLGGSERPQRTSSLGRLLEVEPDDLHYRFEGTAAVQGLCAPSLQAVQQAALHMRAAGECG